MNKSKWLVVMSCLVALCVTAAPNVMMADSWDQATKVTFSGPVQVPGKVLAAGTYWFTLGDSDGDRHIVEIWNADRTHLVRVLPAIFDYRAQAKNETVITFEERPLSQPEAVHSWFYPGSDTGVEFVYAK